MEVVERLRHLAPHWMEHNESHAAQLEEWAGKARKGGLVEVADEMAAAAGAMREAKGRLAAAARLLQRVREERS